MSSPVVTGCFTTGGGNIQVCSTASNPCDATFNDIQAASAITNKYRTLSGFSTQAEAKMTGQAFFEQFKIYYGAGDYAHQRVMDALYGNGTCNTCDSAARIEIAKKGSAYMNVWMYVIREMEDAITDCTAGCSTCNDDPVHAWDEAVAFYSGSLEGSSAAGNTAGK